MKKHRYLGVLLVSVIFSMLICVNVYADNKCSEDTARAKYNPQITYDSGVVMISVKEGTFNVKTIGSYEYEGSVSGSSPLIIQYDENDGAVIEATLVLQNSNCEYIAKLAIDVPAKATKVPNTNYNGVCAAFRNGTNYEKYFEGDIVKSVFKKFYYNSPTISEEYRNFYRTNLSYCLEENVSENLSEKVTKDLIVDSVNYISGLNASINLSASVNKDEKFEELWESVPNNKNHRFTTGEAVNAITLKCNPFGFTKLAGDNYYTNETKYSNIKTEVTQKEYKGKMVDACEKTCREVVTVKYGPPVASKAGLCFEYKVKIQSKMNCESKPIVNVTPPTLPNVCNPYPVCNHYTGYTDQGGPSDDFDKCVNKCDGGKYSQSCINKCYNKVYKGSTNNLASEFDNYKVEQLSLSSDFINSVVANVSVDLYSTNPGGKYIWKNGKIEWARTKGSDYKINGKVLSDRSGNSVYALGKYYFNSVELTKRTLYGLNNIAYTTPNGKFVDKLGPYVITSGGFKVATNCKEQCVWTGCSRDQSLDAKEAYTDYSNDLKDYTKLISECAAETSCSNTKSEFTISVNYKTDKDAKPITKEFNDAKATTTHGTDGVDKDIILKTGGCFGGDSSNDYDYMTEWSFPGTWINNKSGEIEQEEPEDAKTWHKVEGKFCTPLNIVSVNTKWWDYKVNYVDKNSSCTLTDSSKKSILNEVNNNQNIKATVTNFGNWKWWNFIINCFYAVNNEPGDYSEENSSTECKIKDSCTGDDCKVDVNNVEFRPVESGDLFPGDGSTAELDIVGRETGFNWSSKATNLNNKDYEITPTALTKAIQERKNEIYLEKNENTYLDYRFVLDSKTINSIISYNNGKKYTDFEGDTFVKNGITVYESNLFRKNGNISSSALKLGTLGCNNQDGSTNNCEKFSDAIVEGNRR